MKKNKDIIKGCWVKIKKLSPASFYLFKDLQKKFPILTCPCHLKNTQLQVKEYFNNDALICISNSNQLTIIYSKDIEILNT